MQVIESKHYLLNQVHCLFFSKAFQLLEPLEKLSAFHDFRYDVIVLLVFEQIYDSDDLWVTFASQN